MPNVYSNEQIYNCYKHAEIKSDKSIEYFVKYLIQQLDTRLLHTDWHSYIEMDVYVTRVTNIIQYSSVCSVC